MQADALPFYLPMLTTVKTKVWY